MNKKHLKRKSDCSAVDQPPLKIKHSDAEVEAKFHCEKCKDDNEEIFEKIQTSLRKAIELLDNKLTKSIAWDIEIIELFYKFSNKVKGQKTIDYVVAGLGIETATKIYTLRLDSLYEDVFRMGSLLNRQSVMHSKKTKEPSELLDTETKDTTKPAQTRRRRRKPTIVGDLQMLNSKKLETNVAMNPFFAKLNWNVGLIEKTDKMLMNLLPTKRSLDAPLWDPLDQTEYECDQKGDLSNKHHGILTVRFVNPKNSLIRPVNADYRLTDEPIESFNFITHIDLCSSDDQDYDFEMREEPSKCDIHDISNRLSKITITNHGPNTSFFGTVTQLPHDSGYLSCYKTNEKVLSIQNSEEILENGLFSSPSFQSVEDEVDDPERVKEPMFAEDLQPNDDQRFEYKYRAVDLIKNFYAGPSYWKFLPRLQSTPKHNIKARRTTKLTKEVTLNDLRKVESDIAITLFKPGDVKQKKCNFPTIQSNLRHILKNYGIDEGIFNRFENSSLNFDDPISPLMITKEISLATESLNCNDMDEDYRDFEDNAFVCSTLELPVHTYMPNKNIHHKMTHRKINIKKIKEISLIVIDNESEHGRQEIKFSSVYSKVSKMLENSTETSCALTLFSLLHAANEGRVTFSQNEDINDFGINLLK